MLIKRYIDLKYKDYFQEHLENECNCNLKDGEKGLCIYGRYIEGLITPQEFLEEIGDVYFDLQYGTYIRTDIGDIARIIGVVPFSYRTVFILDREIEYQERGVSSKTNKIMSHEVEKHSNQLKDLVEVGDIVNGYRIVKIEKDKFYYGYWGNEYVKGDIEEVITKNDVLRYSVTG